MRKFPDFIEAYLSYVKGHEATIKTHKWSCISILAGALERKVWLDRGYYQLFPNLYVFIIGQSGLIKKSTTTGIAVNLLRELPQIKIMSERLTAAALISQMETSHKSFEVGSKPYKQAAVFAYASELSVFLMEVFGSIVELLTTFFDCQPNDFSKPWTYNTKGGGLTKIYGPCLNMLGASTKTWLKKCIPESEMEGGFSSRVVFVVENNPPTKLVPWPTIPKEQEQKRIELISDLTRIYSLTGRFQVTAGAHHLFAEWYEKHMTEVVPHSFDPRFNGYLGRKGDLILKLSMIRSVSLRDELSIYPEDVLWAVEQLDELEPAMKEAFGVEKPEQFGILYDILRHIESKPEVSHTEIVNIFSRLSSPDTVRNHIFQLKQNGCIEEFDIKEGDSKIVYYRAARPR
jgi:hypothetical protein